jgi:hypothetical protein
MRARWVLSDPSPKPPTVGMTWVASWWPGKYHFVFTKDNSTSPFLRLRHSLNNLKQGVACAEAQVGECFVTVVLKSDRNGAPRSRRYTSYSREYARLPEAKAGHAEIVRLLVEGRLHLRNGFNGLLKATEIEK